MMRLSLFALAGALLLAGCHRQAPEESEDLNNSANVTVPHNEVAPAPLQPPVTNTAEAPAPSLNFSDEAQMRDDADATGLTARLPREEAANAAAAKQ